jgi:uncharacterized protein (DUF433 family)
MKKTTLIEAVYEKGILKPIQFLNLKEKEIVKINIYSSDTTNHYYISKNPEICGGKAAIKGTRITVKVLVSHYLRGENIQDILAGFPQITPAQFYDALSYYYDNKDEIDEQIKAEELSFLLEKYNLQIDCNGILSPRQ